jgi:hypothetical protein
MKYIMIDVDTLKQLYRTNRKLRDRCKRYLWIIDRWRMEKEEEAEEYTRRERGTDRFKGLFNFRF